MADKTPQLGFGSTVPKICENSPQALTLVPHCSRPLTDVFYAFTLAVTVISLIVTVLIAAMSRIKRKVPPGRRLRCEALNYGNLGNGRPHIIDPKNRSYLTY